jgi:hypothetical protein
VYPRSAADAKAYSNSNRTPIEGVRNYLDEISRRWDDALARLKSRVLRNAHRKIRLTSLPRAETRHSVTQILHPTTFLEACVLLVGEDVDLLEKGLGCTLPE